MNNVLTIFKLPELIFAFKKYILVALSFIICIILFVGVTILNVFDYTSRALIKSWRQMIELNQAVFDTVDEILEMHKPKH